MPLVLHQFRASHFNDKVRWALAYKQLPHRRISYLPGPHQAAIRKLSGQTSTPVVAVGNEVVAGSARIIDMLERRFPQRLLYPDEPALRASALAIQDRFDTHVGPATRTVVFSILVRELGYVARLFAHDEPLPKRMAYRTVLPAVRPLIAKANGVTPKNVARSFDEVERALDWVAQSTLQRDALVGDRFSVADLTVAAMLAPIVSLEHPDMQQRPPVPSALTELLSRWQDHAAVRWVQKQYREHRPADAVVRVAQ
jgi:glutathione S-transferase